MKKIVLKIALDIKEICIPLYKILIPFVFIVKLLEISGVIEFLAELIQPLMSLVGLTPELGLVLVTAILVNMYAAIVLFINLIPILDVNVAQVTILTTMILVCHNIPIESAVCKAAGISFTYTAVLRFFSAFLLGFILKLIYFNFELLMDPFDTLVKLDPLPTEFWPWLYYQFVNLVYVFFIVCIMVIILEILKKIGIERLFEIIFVIASF